MARRVRIELPVAQARQLVNAARQAAEAGTLERAARAALDRAREVIERGVEGAAEGVMVTLSMSEAHAVRIVLAAAIEDGATVARLLQHKQQEEALQRAALKLATAIREA